MKQRGYKIHLLGWLLVFLAGGADKPLWMLLLGAAGMLAMALGAGLSGMLYTQRRGKDGTAIKLARERMRQVS